MVRQRWALTPILIALSTLVLLTGCSDQDAAPEQEIIRPVKLYNIDATDAVSIRHFPAELQASDEADLAFRVGGQITKLNVREGQRVERGELLASLDPTDYQLQVELSQANYKLAKAQFDRVKTMLASNATSKSQFDEAKANLDQTENALENAQNQLKYTELRAPYDAVIASLDIENYEYVGASQTILHIQNIEQMDVEFQIPERLVANIQKVALEYHPKVTIDAVPGRVFEGKYKEHRTAPDTTTKSYDATLSLLNPDKTDINLLPGMTATVDIDISAISGQPSHILVPVEAVMNKLDEDGNSHSVVWVYDNEAGTVSPRPVKLGDMTQDSIEILSGLNGGEQIVAAGVNSLTADMKVRPWKREGGI
ncbi:efflux RND transporter periplasmic adaptor subunit [Marinomonas ostreistagni]|uniref:efflux RND transporter periplasmic adaptor subunit n=1 Tax=Marinomonas ostreistagni TaxID=359209 RepID=UPI00195259E2|nr:efflux RND transporter periplasmic adaptor subunit [Marinomonas ostreistagni]MBM6551102.1 efflux RND transporter periplasmic adaptor subunit [Marinomonas ostreistagni]